MNSSQMIFYIGLIVMFAGLLSGLLSFIIFRVTGAGILRQLDQEYGEKDDNN